MPSGSPASVPKYSPTHTDDMTSDRKLGSTTSISSAVKLKQTLGLHHGVAMILGGIIGSGIFVSPKGVLMEVNSIGGSLVIWAVCGVISLIGALCYAELGTSILKSGADYAYISEAYGALPGFLFLWVAQVVILPAGNAVVALTFSYYILQPIFPTCEPPDAAVRLLAALAILLLTAINCWNVNVVAKIQSIFTVTKVAALCLIIVFGIVQLSFGNTENFEEPFADTNVNGGALALALYSGLFSYAGWNFLNYVTEELKDPYKNLPRAIWISMPLVTVIYVLVNVAYFSVLNARELLDSNAVAVTFAERTLGVMAWCMPLFVAASTFGALNGGIFASSRLMFVGARGGQLPIFMSMINFKLFTPIPALIIGCVLSVIMLVSKNVYDLINYTSFVESLFMGISVSGLLYMRYKRPDMHRPIKVNIALPIFFIIIIAFLTVFPLVNNAMACLIGLLMILTGVPVYWIMISWTSKPKSVDRFNRSFTYVMQKLFLSVAEEEEQVKTS